MSKIINSVLADVNGDGLMDTIVFKDAEAAINYEQCHLKGYRSEKCDAYINDQTLSTQFKVDHIIFHPDTIGLGRDYLRFLTIPVLPDQTAEKKCYFAPNTFTPANVTYSYQQGNGSYTMREIFIKFSEQTSWKQTLSLAGRLKKAIEKIDRTSLSQLLDELTTPANIKLTTEQKDIIIVDALSEPNDLASVLDIVMGRMKKNSAQGTDHEVGLKDELNLFKQSQSGEKNASRISRLAHRVFGGVKAKPVNRNSNLHIVDPLDSGYPSVVISGKKSKDKYTFNVGTSYMISSEFYVGLYQNGFDEACNQLAISAPLVDIALLNHKYGKPTLLLAFEIQGRIFYFELGQLLVTINGQVVKFRDFAEYPYVDYNGGRAIYDMQLGEKQKK